MKLTAYGVSHPGRVRPNNEDALFWDLPTGLYVVADGMGGHQAGEVASRMADQASGNNEVHIALKLRQTDAKILQAIEEALQRIEKGTYGICRDCGEPIADARLHAIPWTRVCIKCKEKQKS